MSNDSLVRAFARRDRLVIPACLLGVTVLAWAYLFHLARQMSSSADYDAAMAAMGMTLDKPWTATDVFLTFLMWAVMMVGMMAGSAAPVLLLFAALRAERTPHTGSLPVAVFGLGYLTVWVAFSACAALAQWGLRLAATGSQAMATSSPRMAGVIILLAGAYQLTPIKSACLRRCRSPLGFLMTGWRDGTRGAFEMGVRHGAFCVGCCWSLMCVLYVVGVMNLAWVAALTVFVLVEKMGPAGATIARVAGALMIIAGVVFVAGIR